MENDVLLYSRNFVVIRSWTKMEEEKNIKDERDNKIQRDVENEEYIYDYIKKKKKEYSVN